MKLHEHLNKITFGDIRPRIVEHETCRHTVKYVAVVSNLGRPRKTRLCRSLRGYLIERLRQ